MARLASLAYGPLAALMIGGLLLLPATTATPPPVGSPTGDSLLFLSTAYFINATGEFVNPLYSPVSATGAHFNWHGWLQPWLLASMAVDVDWRSLLLAQGLLSTVGATLLAVVLWRTTAPPWQRLLLLIPGVLAFHTYAARPETIAASLLLLGAWTHGHLDLHPRWQALWTALILGLLGCTHPAVAILTGVLMSALALRHGLNWGARSAGAVLAGAVGLCLLLTHAVHPLGTNGWLQGVLQHAQWVTARKDGAFLQYFLLTTGNLGVGLTLLGSSLWLLGRSQAWRWNTGARLALLAFAFLAWFLGVRTPVTHFNLTAFLPLMLIAVARTASTTRLNIRDGLLLTLIVAGPILSTGKLLATNLLVLDAAAVSYTEARQRLNTLRQSQASVAVSGAALVLAETPAITRELRWLDGRSDSPVDALFVLQAHTGWQSPPVRLGYRLCDHNFNHTPSRWLGIPFSRTGWGWDYAVYVREANACPKAH